MRNDPAWNIQLVQLVEKHPIIWNTKLLKYGNRPETEKAWNTIAKQLNETTATCNDKWKVLRGGFSRALKNNPQYYLAKYMMFLKPHMTTVQRKQLGSSRTNDDENYSSEDGDGDIADESHDQNNYVDIVDNEFKDIDLLPEDTVEDAATSEHNDNENAERNPKKRKSDFEESFVEYVNLLKQTKMDPDLENPDFVFFKSLLPDIEKLDNSDKMKFKMSVMETLNDMLYNKEPMSD